MKMTRTKLKSLVKECLVEILSEGIKPNESSLQEKRKRQDRFRQEEIRLAEHRKSLETRIEDTVTTLTDDKVLQSILADTAKTTFQEQASHESRAPGSPSTLMGEASGGIDLGSIFEESSGNWSEIAFSKKNN